MWILWSHNKTMTAGVDSGTEIKAPQMFSLTSLIVVTPFRM